jgi:phytoene dehydrogenase-like protein
MTKKDHDLALSRRSVLKLMGLASAAATLPGCAKILKKNMTDNGIESISPIDRSIGNIAPKGFSGDNPDRAHGILWDKQAYLAPRGGIPPVTESTDLVIIGGGLSGLTSAYLLRQHNPIILERAERFGGNSKGESWEGADYSIGAAYFMEPEKGTGLDNLLKELGVYNIARIKTEEDPIVLKGKRFYKFWEGETDPKKAFQFEKLTEHFENVCNSKHGLWFPSIPLENPNDREKLNRLDKITFKKHLESVVGGKLHPHIETTIEHFCWSSYGASMTEISAAAGLNFYAAEFGGQNMMITPGGNAAIAELALKKVAAHVPRSNLRSGCIVFDVSVDDDGANITYENAEGQLKTIRAKSVIMACPKFVVSKILNNMETKRVKAIAQLRYNSYLVANVLLKSGVKDDFYDLFLIGNGETNGKDIEGSAQKQKVTDVVHGTYAKPRQDLAVMTLYRALPYTGGRSFLFADGTYDKIKGEFEEQINREILTLVGKKSEDIVDLRLARWGHPLPVAEAGLINKGIIDTIRKPFGKRVFFIEQDNWMLPALETSCGEALAFAPIVDQFLRSKT